MGHRNFGSSVPNLGRRLWSQGVDQTTYFLQSASNLGTVTPPPVRTGFPSRPNVCSWAWPIVSAGACVVGALSSCQFAHVCLFCNLSGRYRSLKEAANVPILYTTVCDAVCRQYYCEAFFCLSNYIIDFCSPSRALLMARTVVFRWHLWSQKNSRKTCTCKLWPSPGKKHQKSKDGECEDTHSHVRCVQPR